jgi:hypothetical protein
MPRLSPPELRVICTILTEEFGPTSPLLERVPSLEFKARHLTGTGYYIDFSNPTDLPPINKLNTELSQDLRTTLPAPRDIVGFTLFIRDGYPTSFEGYTFGDVPWPDEPMESWLIFDATVNNRSSD